MIRPLVFLLLLILPTSTFAQMTQGEDPPTEAPIAPIDASDFLGSVPLLNEVAFEKYRSGSGMGSPVHREHKVYHIRQNHVVAFSFIRDEPRNKRRRDEEAAMRRGEVYGKQALEAFAAGCANKGGTLENVRSDVFIATFNHLFDGNNYWGWYNGAQRDYTEFELAVCRASSTQALAALTVTRDLLRHQTAIVLFAPTVVITEAEIDRKEAEARAAAQREIDHLNAWRTNLASGDQSACGPVLSVRGDLVEVIETATRQPAWYRRSELRPARTADGRRNFCS